MPLPVLVGGVPLLIGGLPALADDPCTCCDQPCTGCAGAVGSVHFKIPGGFGDAEGDFVFESRLGDCRNRWRFENETLITNHNPVNGTTHIGVSGSNFCAWGETFADPNGTLCGSPQGELQVTFGQCARMILG